MKKMINFAIFGALALAVCATSAVVGTKNSITESASAQYTPSATYTNGDAATYYNSINDSDTGLTLLTNLRSLNLSKRKKALGYDSMGTSANSSAYIYTDYDPSSVKYDSNGQPYGTKILSFYSGVSTTSWNREHVWPNSRGGGKKGSAGSPYPDADIYMPRPTVPAENSNRGNSVYYEGRADDKDGWDPVQAFEIEDPSIGCYGGIRGECARIIFYCMTVNANLELNESTSNNGKNMGKLTDLLKWNIQYAVNQREKNRNEGGEYLQGNRNAFVDHPEYACKIWGNTSDATRQICSGVKYDSVTLDKTTATLNVGGTVDLTATASDGSTNFTWTTSNSAVATVANGKVTAVAEGNATITVSATIDGKTLTATCAITVTNGTVPPTPDTKGTLNNPFTPSEARTNAMTGQAYVKGEAQNIKVNGSNVSMTLFDVNNMSSETGINVYDIDLNSKTIEAGNIVTIKATKSTTNVSLIAPGSVEVVEGKEAQKGDGSLQNPFKPSEARTNAMTGQAYVKGEAQNVKVDGSKVTLTLFDIGNMTAETGINVYEMELNGKTILNGDIVTVKATKSTTNISLIAPGFIYSVEKPQPKENGGCSGSIVGSSIILFSSAVAGLALVIAQKKKEEK